MNIYSINYVHMSFCTYYMYLVILIVCFQRTKANFTRKVLTTHTNSELHCIYYIIFDILFLHDTNYMCVIIVRARPGHERNSETIHVLILRTSPRTE